MSASRVPVATPRAMVNLVVDLSDARFDPVDLHHEIEAQALGGVIVERYVRAPESILSWIDETFGGTWSSETALSGCYVARVDGVPIGFAAFDARGLRFSWLRGLGRDPGVGIFGPFGVAAEYRGREIGPLLLRAACFGLRERGYERALVPAVGSPRLAAYYEREAGAVVAERFDLPLPARPARTVVLASGNGSNFGAVVAAARDGRLPIDVRALVTNRPHAGAIARAHAAGIETAVLPWARAEESREAYDERIAVTTDSYAPDLVLLLGWMHVLSAKFVVRFSDVLNIHPALLPLDPAADRVTMPDGMVAPVFRGPRAVDDAIAAGVPWVGASVHRVGVDVDRGEVLARAPLRRIAGESREALDERLHALEHRVLETAIRRWLFERP